VSFFRAVKVALSALAANKMRSVLAVLGIVIGVAAVIMVVAMGKGAQAKVEDSISKLGVNLVFVWPGTRSTGAGAASRQIHRIAVMNVSPSTRPMPGASTMKSSVLVHPDARIAPGPALATAAPA